MGKKLLFIVSIIFLSFFSICIFLYEIALPSSSLYSWQSFFLLIATIAIAIIFFSFAIQFVVVLPLKKFNQNLEETWKEKQNVFASSQLPAELYDIDQTFLSIVSVIENKTATFQKMGQLDEFKSEFVTIASHQLRTPLTEIKWAIELVSNSLKKNDEDLLRLVGGARDAVARINAIVAQLLSVTEMSLDQVVKRIGPVDLEEIIRLAVKENEALALKRGISFVIQKKDGYIPTIIGDVDLLRFIFINLIKNAINYGFLGRPVIIRLQSLGKTIDVSVENEGICVDPNERSMLFDKFWRGSAAKQMSPDGSGLALYLTKKIVERYGGSIVYKVPTMDRNIFSVQLPVDANGEVQTFITKY